MPSGQDNTKKTKIEKIVKRKKPEWIEKYNKDGIIVYGDPIFGRVKLTTPEGTDIGKNIVAIGGIVAFGEYYEGGIGKLSAYHPYIPREVMDMLRGA